MNSIQAICNEAVESWDRDSINGPVSLTHSVRACFADETTFNLSWGALTEACVARAKAQGKPERDGLLRAWDLFEHHVFVNPLDWVGQESPDDEFKRELRDLAADLLIQDFLAIFRNGDTEALRAYGDHHSTPSFGEIWQVVDTRRAEQIKDSKRLMSMLDKDTSGWLDELDRIKNAACTIRIESDNSGVMAYIEYPAREVST